jgi:poly-gamma-glutamate synthesis protein (capsule biosynthesis protein)
MTFDPAQPICLFLCGDVMTGRGIDQVLPRAGNPVLYERYVRDARAYVQLAEDAHGPIPEPVSFDYVWGEALKELQRARTDVRIINLETSITSNDEYWPGKEVLYRMHPENIGCLTAAQIDCCCLANNHVLDWGYPGLEETLQTLDRVGLAHAGAGHNATEAAAPAVIALTPASAPRGESQGEGGRALVFAFASPSSGVPWQWSATEDRPGVNLLDDLSGETARHIASRTRAVKRPGDVLVASIHWGSNWGYEIPNDRVQFAHRLIEEGVDIIHGHSSHHVKAIEVYGGRLILYGCGNFLTDYEGIRGYEWFRSDLALMYLVQIDPRDARLVEARLVPFQSRRFRLARTSVADAKWLCDLLNRLGTRFGTQVALEDDHSITLCKEFLERGQK